MRNERFYFCIVNRAVVVCGVAVCLHGKQKDEQANESIMDCCVLTLCRGSKHSMVLCEEDVR